MLPDFVHARLKLGLLLAQQGQFESAKVQLQRVAELEPTNDLAWYNLGGIDAAQGRWQEAAREFGKVVELKPKDADAHLRRGGALAQAHQKEAAIGEFERAAELTNRREPQILLALADAYASAGRLGDAIAAAQQARTAAAAQPGLEKDIDRRLQAYRTELSQGK